MTEQRLTLNDPVSKEEREYLQQLSQAKSGVADKLLELELEKVNLIAAARRIDLQIKGVFQKILVDRGQAPERMIQVDLDTGTIQMAQPSVQTPVKEEEPPSEV